MQMHPYLELEETSQQISGVEYSGVQEENSLGIRILEFIFSGRLQHVFRDILFGSYILGGV